MDELVTLFGGGGFLGRYVAQELLKAGARVRVAERDPSDAWYLKPLGGLGQTQFVSADVTRADSARRAAQGSTAVINLIGILKGDFERVHVEGARNAALAAAAAGAGAFVQVSAIGADANGQSAYARTKGRGEEAACTAFPQATIIRPSIIFGAEDRFVNRFAGMIARLPVVPVIRGGVRFQPVWAADVGRAIAQAALDPKRFGGRTFELGGPERISMGDLQRWIARAIGVKGRFVAVPDGVAAAMARLPGSPMTWDQWLLLQHDNVVAQGAESFDAFGFEPKSMEAAAPRWLVRFRREGRFSLNAA